MVKRRSLFSGGLALGAAALPLGTGRRSESAPPPEVEAIPQFCTHEHWGSVFSMGDAPHGFRADVVAGALPERRTTLVDLIVDPYMGWNLGDAGVSPRELDVDGRRWDVLEVAQQSLEKALALLRPTLADQRFTGTFRCTRDGVRRAYGVDVDAEPAALQRANERVGSNYAELFKWYRQLQKREHLGPLIRPVHPEFYVTRASAETAADERSITRTVVRIDPLLDLWKETSRRRELAAVVDVEPLDAGSWREFLARILDLAASGGAVGIKQLQAYRRPLSFAARADAAVRFAGELDPDEARALEDWIVHECSKLAHERGWPHQVHVGTDNLAQSGPLPLAGLAREYPRQKLVLIHCWPFLRETGYLAKRHANVFLDTCWLPILSPVFLAQALEDWLSYVPMSKITMGNDATTVEMAVGSAAHSRAILWEALSGLRGATGLGEAQLRGIATDLLHDNAVRVYGLGELQRE